MSNHAFLEKVGEVEIENNFISTIRSESISIFKNLIKDVLKLKNVYFKPEQRIYLYAKSYSKLLNMAKIEDPIPNPFNLSTFMLFL